MKKYLGGTQDFVAQSIFCCLKFFERDGQKLIFLIKKENHSIFFSNINF